jgi:ubiquinone/menaquinone biosynthesis C-methylase UbiE
MEQALTLRAQKGWGMEGYKAKWYANLTRQSMPDFKGLARRIADQLPRGGRVLEVAPGPGYFAIELAKLGNFLVWGLDISRTFVDIARDNSRGAGVIVDFRQGNASAMPLKDQSFDFVFCRAAFKDFAEPLRALHEMHRVLRTGGRGLIIDLRRDAAPESINAAVDEMSMGAINSLIAKLTFRYKLLKRAYTKPEFEQFLRQTKFKSFEVKEDSIGLEASFQRAG